MLPLQQRRPKPQQNQANQSALVSLLKPKLLVGLSHNGKLTDLCSLLSGASSAAKSGRSCCSLLLTTTSTPSCKTDIDEAERIGGSGDMNIIVQTAKTLRTLLHALSNPGAEDKLREAAKGVQEAVEGCLVAEQHSTKYPGAHGMTIRLNATRDAKAPPVAAVVPNMEVEDAVKMAVKPCHANHEFVKETDWQKVQDRLAQKVDGFAEEDSLVLAGGLTPEDLISIVGGLLGSFLSPKAEEAPKA